MKISCMIVDDEPLAIEVLQNHIQKVGSLEVAACCQNAMEAFEVLQQKKIDLIFMDIQMPGMKGTDFIRTLVHPPKIILTTAYREYALEGYELDVVDYLVKPVSFERFFKAVSKYLRSMTKENGPGISRTRVTGSAHEDYVYVKGNKKVNKVLLYDIQYVESMKDYITIHTVSGKIVVKHTLVAFEEMLPPDEFLRIHRSYIIPISRITGFTSTSIDLPEITLPIGSNYRSQVFSTLKYTPTKD